MRAIWSGSISFGLVNIPIKLYSATGSNQLNFDMLDKENLSPIQYKKVSRQSGKEVEYKNIVKGYALEGGEYVVVDDEDFKKAAAEKSDTIDIVDFVSEEEIDPIYYEKPYYLEPDKKAGKPYVLLRDALRDAKKVAIAEFVMRTRERLGVIKPYKDVLVLNQIRYQDEIRDATELNIPADTKAEKKELEMALALIDQMTNEFDPTQYKDTYVEELRKVIEAKAKGHKAPEPKKAKEPERVPDLMAALRASLQGSGNGKKRAGGRRRKASS